jgi:HK97 gp10 family phage protein
MANSIKTTVLGLDKLDIKLTKMFTGVSSGALSSKTTLDIAEAVVAKAKEKVPVMTGALKKSIRVEHGEAGSATLGSAHVVAGGPGDWGQKTGDGVVYATYVEMGTRKMAAQPYLRPAIEEVMHDASVNEKIAKQIKELWGGL